MNYIFKLSNEVLEVLIKRHIKFSEILTFAFPTNYFNVHILFDSGVTHVTAKSAYV